MIDSSLKNMKRSFKILDNRRSTILHDKETIDLKEMVKKIRKNSVSHLSRLIENAAKNLTDNGIEVIFAKDAQEAKDSIYHLVKDEKIIAKSKSNTAGEIQLTEYLQMKDIEVVETDLGDRIVQFDSSRPTHPIGPACHLNMDNIAEIVSKKFEKKIEAEPRAILDAVKSDILEKIPKCKVGITGANSVAAEDGSLVMVHNEGNISLLTMMDLHIIIIGIDKLVSTIEETISVVKLETRYATGKKVPAYMNVISSPSKTADIEQILLKDMYGAKRVVVVFLDNGRSKALKENPECLWCIGCGSCIVNCPVYNNLGPEFGYLRHLGGRGIVLSHYIDEDTCYDSGLYQCTLCGQCNVECPVEIPINDMLEELRAESVKNNKYPEKHGEIRDNIKKYGSPFNK